MTSSATDLIYSAGQEVWAKPYHGVGLHVGGLHAALHHIDGLLHEGHEGAGVQEGLLNVVFAGVLHNVHTPRPQRLPQDLQHIQLLGLYSWHIASWLADQSCAGLQALERCC